MDDRPVVGAKLSVACFAFDVEAASFFLAGAFLAGWLFQNISVNGQNTSSKFVRVAHLKTAARFVRLAAGFGGGSSSSSSSSSISITSSSSESLCIDKRAPIIEQSLSYKRKFAYYNSFFPSFGWRLFRSGSLLSSRLLLGWRRGIRVYIEIRTRRVKAHCHGVFRRCILGFVVFGLGLAFALAFILDS